MQDQRIGRDDGIAWDVGISAQDRRIRIQDHMIADVRMTLASLEKVSFFILAEAADTQRHTVIHTHMIAYDSRLTDDDARTVVNTEILSDPGTRIDVDACLFMRIFRDDTGNDRNVQFVQFMSDAIEEDRKESRKG